MIQAQSGRYQLRACFEPLPAVCRSLEQHMDHGEGHYRYSSGNREYAEGKERPRLRDGSLIGFLFWCRVQLVSRILRARHDARQAERDRIARDLHDTLLQSTEGLILRVYTAAQQLAPGDPIRAFLMHSVDLAEELAVEARQKILGLRQHSQTRPELSQALAVLGLELSAVTTTTFSAGKKGRVKGLAAATWDEVFSIAREAINNAFRHADADHIEAVVTYGSSNCTVQIRDDGRGVPKDVSLRSGKPAHLGLRLMRERAEQLHAELIIDSGADRGTTVSLVVPGPVAYLRRSASLALSG
jgi:signal transduction histidine kinase